MSARTLSFPLRVALVGGDGRLRPASSRRLRVSCFGSTRDEGRGALRRLSQALRAGNVDVVLVMARFCGHDAWALLRARCAAASVPLVAVTGGRGALRRTLAGLVREVPRG